MSFCLTNWMEFYQNKNRFLKTRNIFCMLPKYFSWNNSAPLLKSIWYQMSHFLPVSAVHADPDYVCCSPTLTLMFWDNKCLIIIKIILDQCKSIKQLWEKSFYSFKLTIKKPKLWCCWILISSYYRTYTGTFK